MARIPYYYLLALPTAALLACGSEPEYSSAELPAALQQDLELARASSMELANGIGAGTQVVSGLEAARPGTEAEGDRAPRPTPEPNRRPEPAPVVRQAAQQVAAQPTPEPEARQVAELPAPEPTEQPLEEVADVVEAPAPVAEEVAPEQLPTPEPVIAAVPQPTDDGMGDSPARDPGGWGGESTAERSSGGGIWGAIGAAILRGGTIGDDDHCEIHIRNGQRVVRNPVPRGTVHIPRAGGNARSSSTIRSREPASTASSTAGRSRTRGG